MLSKGRVEMYSILSEYIATMECMPASHSLLHKATHAGAFCP